MGIALIKWRDGGSGSRQRKNFFSVGKGRGHPTAGIRMKGPLADPFAVSELARER